MKTSQFELSNAAEAFNLAAETSPDPDRIAAELAAARRTERESRAIDARRQRDLFDPQKPLL